MLFQFMAPRKVQATYYNNNRFTALCLGLPEWAGHVCNYNNNCQQQRSQSTDAHPLASVTAYLTYPVQWQHRCSIQIFTATMDYSCMLQSKWQGYWGCMMNVCMNGNSMAIS